MRLPSGVFNYSYAEDMAIIRTKTQWGLFVGFLILMLLAPLFLNPFIISIIITILTYIVVVQGLQLLTGYTGQGSVAQSAFMGIGAFTTASLSVKFHIMSYWAALPFAGIVAGLVGVLFGFPSFKVKGLYLFLVSIAAQFIIMYVILHWPSLTGGVTGIHVPPPEIGSLTFGTTEFYYLALAVAGLTTFFVKNIVRTRVGRAFIAVRDNDIAAEVMGVNIFRYKMLAFFLGCFIAGVAGWFWVGYINIAHFDHYTLDESIWFLGMVVVGGLGSVLGTIFGVIFIQLVREATIVAAPALAEAFPALGIGMGMALPMIVLGLAVALFLIFEPRGLVHRWGIFKRSYRLWPYSR